MLSLVTFGESKPLATFTPNRMKHTNRLVTSIHFGRNSHHTLSTNFLKFDVRRDNKSSHLQSLNLNNDENLIQNNEDRSIVDSMKSWLTTRSKSLYRKPPPMQIEDTSVLFYDIFLILNLSLSISFWVVHRMSLENIAPALSEGSLLSILWIIAGLWNGSFLFSATDGHYDINSNDPEHEGKGGPTSAALLGLSTFVTTANLRVLVALGTSMLEHRKVGITNGEELIPLEIAFGLILMSAWRMMHSRYTRP